MYKIEESRVTRSARIRNGDNDFVFDVRVGGMLVEIVDECSNCIACFSYEEWEAIAKAVEREMRFLRSEA